MHVDKSQTHIVSFILHIDSSDDAEPWPIAIEDFQGSESQRCLQEVADFLFPIENLTNCLLSYFLPQTYTKLC